MEGNLFASDDGSKRTRDRLAVVVGQGLLGKMEKFCVSILAGERPVTSSGAQISACLEAYDGWKETCDPGKTGPKCKPFEHR
jgi:hypothetical protein